MIIYKCITCDIFMAIYKVQGQIRNVQMKSTVTQI